MLKLQIVKNTLLGFVLLLGSFYSHGQKDVMKKDEGSWNTLSMVTYQRVFDETFGIDIEKPV